MGSQFASSHCPITPGLAPWATQVVLCGGFRVLHSQINLRGVSEFARPGSIVSLINHYPLHQATLRA